MITPNPYRKYQHNQIQTMPAGKLVVMLYDGAIKFLNQAIAALSQEDFEKTHNCLSRTQDIINELIVTLNFEAGSVAQNLYSLYEYMNYNLIQANIKKDEKNIMDVIKLLEDLRRAWVEINNGKGQQKITGVNCLG